VSTQTTELVRALGVEPAAVFPSYVDARAFLERPPAPLPERPRAVFVGVLERYKNVDRLAEAWRRAAPRIPEASLHVVGSGSRSGVVSALGRDLGDRVVWTPELSPEGVAAALDEAWALVLPSRSEGMGRVVVEAFCRGRGVIGADVGGIRDIVEPGKNGLLVDPTDTVALADAIVRVLSDRGLAERLGAAARATATSWIVTPDEFAERLRSLVERVAAGARS
jgi:glycosyltransferase involved in cell wall biosynthesis